MVTNNKDKEWSDDEFRDKLVLARLLNIVDKIPESKIYFNLILNSLTSVLNFDIAFEAASAKFLSENTDDVVEIEKAGWIDSMRRKFSELIFLDRMIHITGMYSFREKIMEEHIGNLFSVNKQKQIPLSEILKKLSGELK